MPNLSFFFWNARTLGPQKGLPPGTLDDKISYIQQQTNNHTFTVICETQFKNHHKFNSTLVDTSTHPGYAKNRGIIVLAAPHVRVKCKPVAKTEFSVSIEFLSNVFTFVYYPPSMSVVELTHELSQLPMSTVILGDFNTRLHHTDTLQVSVGYPSKPPERAIPLARYVQSHTLRFPQISHAHNTDWGVAFWPSTMSKLSLPPNLSRSSDHSPILFLPKISLDLLPPPPPTFRLRLSQLKSQWGRVDVCVCYATKHPIYMRLLESAQARPDSHLVLDTCTNFIVDDLIDLGDYAGGGRKEYPDALLLPNTTPARLGEPLSQKESLRRLASMNRFGPPARIIGDTTGDPLIDSDKYFSELFKDRTPAQKPIVWPVDPSIPIESILPFFSPDAIWSVISSYSSSKSCGPDGLPAGFLKILVPSYPQKESDRAIKPDLTIMLSSLFSWCVKCGHVPSSWLDTLVIPIVKKDSEGPISSFRPITLTQVVRRFFEACLLRLFAHHPRFQSILHIHPCQSAFRKNNSCYVQIMALHDSMQVGAQYVGFIDWKTAYDSVSPGLLWEKLAARGVPHCIGVLLEALLSQTYGRAVVNGHLSYGFARTRGLLQGSLLSPFLFNLFIDDLAVKIYAENDDPINNFPPALLYADDLSLLARTPRRLQRLFDVVSEWCKANLMILNIDKCGVLVPDIANNLHTFTLSSKPVPIVPEYKYLGVPVHSVGVMFSHFVERRVELARKRLAFFSANIFEGAPSILLLDLH
eukprot:comp24348_c5_seq7/m.46509 comp24348_c5_seq7/g.46509  ORF comp24348_c5_seq7/g.46509 comp24348_c5_seq7/m.46509 type:complete len:752 (-) comp24348_c5_seq7:38-2293(-)